MPAPQKNRPLISAKRRGQQRVPSHAPKRELNGRLALISLIVAAMFVPTAWGWHYFQVSQQSRSILARARKLAKEGEHARSLRYFQQYLITRPDDVAVRVDYATSMDELGKENPLRIRDASQAYARVLGMAPNHAKSKIRYAELLLLLGEAESALKTSLEILETHDEDTDEGQAALRIRAMALLDRGVTDAVSPGVEVRTAVEQAIAANPNDVEIPYRYAEYLRAFPRATGRRRLEDFANNLMDSMLRRNEDNPDAYVNLYQYRKRFGLSNVDVDLEIALSSFPKDARFVVFKAQQETSEGKFEDALATYTRALKVDPKNRNAYLGIASLYRYRDDKQKAQDILKQGLEEIDSQDILLRLELADVSIDLNDLDNATSTLKKLDQRLARIGGSLVPSLRLDLEAMVATLHGRLAMSRDEGRVAISYFENGLRRTKAEGISDESRYKRRVLLLQQLARLYDSFREWDRVAGFYDELISLEPAEPRWRIQKAYSQQKSGQWGRAAGSYQLALSLEGCPAQAHYDYARALLMAESSVAKANRSWGTFQAALAKAESLTPSVYTHVLMVEYHLINGERLAALEALHVAEEKMPLDAPAADMFLLASIYRRLGRDSDVDRIAERINAQDPANVESLLVRADQLWQQGKQKETAKLIEEATSSDRFSDQAKARLLVGLGELQRSVGDLAASERTLNAAIRLESGEFDPYSKLSKILVTQKRWKEHKSLVAQLKAVEGESGTIWRELTIEAMLGQEDIRNRDVQVMTRIVEQIRDLRPTWPRTYTLLAEIAIAGNKRSTAIDHYERGFQLGDRTPEMFRGVIRLLSDDARIAEAQQYSLRFASHWPSLQASPLSVAKRMQEQANESSIAEARRNLKDNPTQATAHTRLAQLLIFAGNAEEAKGVLEKATQRFPDQPSMWIALFNAYIALSDKEGAEDTLRHIAAAKVLSGPDLYLAMAQGHQLLGNADEAEGHYLEALRLAPYNSVALNLAVRFFLAQENEEGLRKSVETTKSEGAKRAMALLLASRGGDQNWDEAIRMLSQDVQTKSDPKNLRLQAMIFARRGSAAHRRTAIRLLEQIINSKSENSPGESATPSDFALLFSLYRDVGEMKKAAASLDEGLTRYTDNLSLLMAACDFAIAEENLNAAKDYLSRITTINDQPEVIAGLTARSAHAAGDDEGAKAEVERLLATTSGSEKNDNEKRVVRLACAGIYEQVEAFDEAEALLKELVKGDGVSKKPLVGFYLRQRRQNLALETALTQKADEMSRTDFVLLCSLVSYADPLAEYRSKVNAVLGEGLVRWGNEPDVLFALATLSYMRGEIPQAISLFERLLRISPNNVAALNNLSLILAESPGRSSEALDLIDRAILASGPQPNLVDTRGLVHLAREDYLAAVQSFQEAVYQVRKPVYLLHLAEAHRLNGNVRVAQATLKQAIAVGLDKTPLNLLDQQINKNLSHLRTP